MGYCTPKCRDSSSQRIPCTSSLSVRQTTSTIPRSARSCRACARSQNDVHRIVHEEFVHWFGAEIAGPSETYAAVSQEIWNVWQQSGGGPSKGPPPARGHGRVRAKHAPRRIGRGG